MKLKKASAFLAAVACAGLIFTGCSERQDMNIIKYESEEVTKSADKSPVIATSEINAVILLPDDPESGACMSAAHANAFNDAAKELGITSKSIPSADPENVKSDTKDANVIFGAGYDYMNPLFDEAEANPDKLYACFGGYKYNSSNYSNYYTAIYEAQYLAGVVAGTNTVSGKIGIISEYSAEFPDSATEINSFTLGVKAANSEAEVFVYSLSSRTDTSKAAEYTKSLIKDGCDVISIQCDTSAPAKIASEKEVFFIGYGIDMKDYGDSCLTSVVWNMKDYYKSALSAAINGTWNSGNYYGNLSEKAVVLSELSSDAATKTNERVKSASELIENGTLEIFSNKRTEFDAAGNASIKYAALTDNKGNTMISEDGNEYFIYSGEELKAIEASTASSDYLSSSIMNYLVEGVTVK